MCFSGDYLECGIQGADGFQAECVVDDVRYLIRVPAQIAPFAVLSEPMSIAQKAIAAAIIRNLVLGNQVLLRSVNASIDHVRVAVEDLQAAHHRWPGTVESIVTARRRYTDHAAALLSDSLDEIETVLEWASIAAIA